jgi:hypothetical protein
VLRASPVLVLLVAVAVHAADPLRVADRPVWRATYFANPDLQGASVAATEYSPSHRWLARPPVAGIPPTRFSARFVSCIAVRAPTKIKFGAAADDGIRLFVDGQRLIDAWFPQDGKTLHTGTVVLSAPGPHRLVVEYFQATDSSALALKAAIAGGPMGELPSKLLSLPGAGHDCAE